MTENAYRWLYELEPGEGDPARLASIGERLVQQGDLEVATTAYDRAYGLDPDDQSVSTARARLLSRLAVREQGVRFRYVPAGCYAIGSLAGDPDEQPVHIVQLKAFWLSEIPISWSAYCALMQWEPPPTGTPTEMQSEQNGTFFLYEANKIRLQYCEDATIRATDWHAHAGNIPELFGAPAREDPRRPERFDRKPMVAVSWQEAQQLAERLSGGDVMYRLPTEAEWEAAARGGLIGKRYSWGDEPPTPEQCDFGRFDQFSIQPTRLTPTNGYGLYGMNGGVWEWTSDWYDALFYSSSPRDNPTGPDQGIERVLRGGSWADCADVVTVSFRMSREATPWWDDAWGKHLAPNIGFRLCRVSSR